MHTDVTEELDVAVEEDLSQKKTENIPKWPDGILDYLDATERNKVWVLNGATVLYGSASELRATLDYDFAEEKKFSYKNLSMEEIIHHLAIFISRLWQIHVFGDGKVTLRYQQNVA